MQFANNENGLRTYIKDAEENSAFFCPYCNAPMIQRRGQVNIPHFAHAKGHLCSDSWTYEEMSEWHCGWQYRYPKECQEFAVENALGRHRADVLINNTVIEFQHSPISAEEFQKRNDFYTACGYRVIWLFDAREVYEENLTMDETGIYRWKHAPKMLTGFDLYGDVAVYFQLKDVSQEEDGIIIRLTWCDDGDLSYFKSAPPASYTEEEFVKLTSAGELQRETDVSGKNELYHKLQVILREDTRKKEVYGCPMNPGGYAPDTSSYDRRGCNDCGYSRMEIDIDGGSCECRCACRFKEYLEQIDIVLDVKKTNDGQIYGFTYISKDGSIKKVHMDIPESPAVSIPELAEKYGAGIMIVRNVRTGYEFKITRDIQEMWEKYKGKIYGRLWCSTYNCFQKNGDKIYGASKKEWVAVWHKTEREPQIYRHAGA